MDVLSDTVLYHVIKIDKKNILPHNVSRLSKLWKKQVYELFEFIIQRKSVARLAMPIPNEARNHLESENIIIYLFFFLIIRSVK